MSRPRRPFTGLDWGWRRTPDGELVYSNAAGEVKATQLPLPGMQGIKEKESEEREQGMETD